MKRMTNFERSWKFLKNKKNEQDPELLQRLVRRVNGKSDLAKLATIATIHHDRIGCYLGNHSDCLGIRSWQ
jgi:hypothetical protein